MWHEARTQARTRPSDENRLRVVPIILNVKGKDLFYIDRASKRFNASHRVDWEKLGVDEVSAFDSVEFYAPQQKGTSLPLAIQDRGNEVKPYSWSLRDVVERDLLLYLFAEDDATQANFAALVYDIIGLITEERMDNDGSVRRALRTGNHSPFASNAPTFRGLLGWLRDESDKGHLLSKHQTGTIRKLYRRLFLLLQEGAGVLRADDERGQPLEVVRQDTSAPASD